MTVEQSLNFRQILQYSSMALPWICKRVYDWLHIVAYINPQLSIMFESTEDGDYNEIIHYEDGLADYLDWMAEETKQEILDKYYETNGKGFECAIGFTDTAEMDPKWSLSWFTNTTANLNGRYSCKCILACVQSRRVRIRKAPSILREQGSAQPSCHSIEYTTAGTAILVTDQRTIGG